MKPPKPKALPVPDNFLALGLTVFALPKFDDACDGFRIGPPFKRIKESELSLRFSISKVGAEEGCRFGCSE
jgi:hypothetical protein